MQELTAPEVQPLALEAKTAAALVKYVPWPGRLLPQLTNLSASAPGMEPWMARGAALAFAQVIRGYAVLYILLLNYCFWIMMNRPIRGWPVV